MCAVQDVLSSNHGWNSSKSKKLASYIKLLQYDETLQDPTSSCSVLAPERNASLLFNPDLEQLNEPLKFELKLTPMQKPLIKRHMRAKQCMPGIKRNSISLQSLQETCRSQY